MAGGPEAGYVPGREKGRGHMATELWRMSALELAGMIRSGEVSSREVVEAHLARAEACNARVNAVVESFPDRSLAWADEADTALAAGEAPGALHGVPFTIKINLDFAGSATHEGCEALAGLVATSNAPVVDRMRAAGAVPVGRTNMPDLGLRLTTESSLFGATHNPWDHERTAAGSSGGEAAAIASGISPIGLGNDIGGSLRNPAYACGIASIKPGFGRIPMVNPSAPIAPTLSSQLMLVNGVLARRVADVRAGLEILMGSHPSDPQIVDAPLAGPPRSRRIGLVPEPAGGSTDPGVAEGVRAAGRALEAAGYQVEEMAPPRLEEAYAAWRQLLTGDLEVMRPLLDAVIGEAGRRFLDLSDPGAPTPDAAATLAVHQTRFEIGAAWQAMFADYGAIVGPTWTQPPFRLGSDIESQANADAVMEMIRFVLPANLLGLPAACVPTGVTNGLPVGAQVIAPRLREDVCLDLAEVIEGQLGTFTPIDPR
jgi:amidase